MRLETAERSTGRASGCIRGTALTLSLGLSLAAAAQDGTVPEGPAQEGIAPGGAAEDAAVVRGRYVFQAAGCQGCHTDAENDGAPLAGGRALATPFGTFYSPNITPDPETGIGAWSEDDLKSALRDGTSPDGDPYYPAFPYPSYTGMTDADISDLFAYLMAQPPVSRENTDHELDFPYDLRFTLDLWQALFLEAGPFEPVEDKDAAWNRGAYLVRHVTHCGECHSPRNSLGAVDDSQELAGNPTGPDGGKVPNLTPGSGGLADWSESDIAYALQSGMTPDGDFLSDSMGEVIENSTGRLSDADLAAIAKYIKDLTPHPAP